MSETRIAPLVPQIQRFGLEYDTVAKRKKDLGEALENLYRFLNLVGFISLLARRGRRGERDPGAPAAEAKNRRDPALPRRVRARHRFHLFAASGGDGIDRRARGRGARVAMQRIFPAMLKTFICRCRSPAAIAWQPIMRGMLIGFGICVLFALPALLRFRRLSPLLILRSEWRMEIEPRRRDRARRAGLSRDRRERDGVRDFASRNLEARPDLRRRCSGWRW